MPNGAVVTFYSFKGGVGRTFAMANVAVCLARWGYRVLCIDWDLDAPGLAQYLRLNSCKVGLLEMIESAKEPSSSWTNFISEVELEPEHVRLHVITAGCQDETYINRVQQLDWPELYEKKGLSACVETWRDEWKRQYDFVLIDSRTGVTDIGALCTVGLPDLLVFFFTANHQSLDGSLEVVRRAVAAHTNFPYDRSALLAVPVPSRFDSREEYERAKEWRTIFEDRLKDPIRAWVSREVDYCKIIEKLTVPYVPYWSFGEGLPALDESSVQGSLRLSFETVAAAIALRLDHSDVLSESPERYVDMARRASGREPKGVADVVINYTADVESYAKQLYHSILSHGLGVAIVGPSFEDAEGGEASRRLLEQSQHAIFVVGRGILSWQADAMRRFAKQSIEEDKIRMIIPVVVGRWPAPGLCASSK